MHVRMSHVQSRRRIERSYSILGRPIPRATAPLQPRHHAHQPRDSLRAARRFIHDLLTLPLFPSDAQPPALAKRVDPAIGGQRQCVRVMHRHSHHADIPKPSDVRGLFPTAYIPVPELAMCIVSPSVERTRRHRKSLAPPRCSHTLAEESRDQLKETINDALIV
jgi:hypothetical protein